MIGKVITDDIIDEMLDDVLFVKLNSYIKGIKGEVNGN
jgi:hypothetical protein